MNNRLQLFSRWPRVSAAVAAIGVLLMATPAARALDPQQRFQDYVRDNWNVESGLPQISVLSITQDGTGYLWIGTQNGIARFDGVHFTVFNHRSSGVDTTLATVAFTDRKGDPWFGTPHGALRYRDGHFTLLHAGDGNAAITAITDAADGSLLFATTVGVMRLNGDRLEPALLEGEPACGLLRDGNALWVGQTGRVTRVDSSGTAHFSLPTNAARACVSHLALDSGTLWLGTNAGLFRFAQEHVQAAPYGSALDTIGIESLLRDSDGNLWIGTARTLFRVHPDQQLERVEADDFVSDSWVLALFEDREGNVWMGSQTESLFRVWNGWIQRYARRDGLIDPFVWSIARDSHGKIALGTNSNVVSVDAHGASELIAGNQLPNPSAYELYFDRGDRLWIGTRAGLTVYDNGKVQRPVALAPLDVFQINSIVQAGVDDYWIGSSGGLYRYRDGSLARVGAAAGSSAARVRSIHLNAPDDLLIGTESGVRHVHDGSIDTPVWAAPLEGRMVTYIAPIRDGLLGIATLDAGIGLQSGEHLLMLSSEHGLPSDNAWTFGVIDDRLYVAGIEGVWRIALSALPDVAHAPPRTLPTEMVLSASGRERGSQRVRCCNGGAQSRSLVDGENIWFASISGALELNTRAINYSQRAPTVVIEGLRHDDAWTVNTAKPVVLDGGSRDVEIDFTGLSFRDPRSLNFRYRLDGYDTAWVDAGARRAAFYTNLPAGDYHVQVQASLPSGAFSGDNATLAFSLPARWYERTFVRAAVVLLGLLALGVVILSITRRYRAAQHRLEALIDDRTQALSRANERLRHANQVLALESQTDPLTGLHNRRFLLDQSMQLFADNSAESTTAFLLLDLDNFKQVNDRHGHVAGDNVLVQLARLLRQIARDGDQLLRWGGEEFLILLRAVQAPQAMEIAERIRLAVSRHTFLYADGRNLRLTCSIGFSVHPLSIAQQHASDWSLTLELADAALYRVKQQGRDGTLGLIAADQFVNADFALRAELPPVESMLTSGQVRWIRPPGPALSAVQ